MVKKDLYNQIFGLFLDEPINQKYLNDYLDGVEDSHVEVTDDIGIKLNVNFSWMTNLSILDIADMAIKSAESNGNLRGL